jgi:hypothetical protein
LKETPSAEYQIVGQTELKLGGKMEGARGFKYSLNKERS